jgi:uncharacterized protein YqgV (UPF0045/DUF77 family)
MAIDLSTYKNAIANAYEGRAVRDAIVAMVQAVEDAINAGSSGLDSRVTALETTVSGTNGLESQVSALETTVSGTDGLESKVTALETTVYGTGGLGYKVDSLESTFNGYAVTTDQHLDDLDDRVTALEGGGNT